MEWKMLKASKRLFPHWLDKTDNSNFSKHLSILNNQQLDIRHKIKTLDWSRIIDKPLKIHTIQTEPHRWKVEFEVDVPRLKKVNIYKNPTIVNNTVVNSLDVINGYYDNGNFYEKHSTEITNHTDNTDKYFELIKGENGKYYCDLKKNKYYVFRNGKFDEVDKQDVPQTSLIHSETFIDNYSHFYRHTIHEDNANSTIINKFIIDNDNNQKYKTILNYTDNVDNNGKYELTITNDDSYPLYYNLSFEKYFIFEDNEFKEIHEDNIVKLDSKLQCDIVESEEEEGELIYNYYYIYNDEVITLDEDKYYIFADIDENCKVSRIPLIETEDVSPIICNDSYVLEVFTYDDYHFLKGFPEIDYIDYNNNNFIDTDERNYNNINIDIEKIGDTEYLTFRIHQYGLKLIEIFKDEKLIHIADFVIEKFGYDSKQISNNFAHVYNYNDNQVYYPFEKDSYNIEEVNLDVDEYVYRYKITDEDKIFDENGNFELKNKFDLKVTYYNPSHPYNSEYDKVLFRTYVCEDSIFYHDMSLDMFGVFYNVPRHVFTQPLFETNKEELEFYSKTYPTYCNSLNEDDYHYQKRLQYYINNYNKEYFPCLELWKYFHIDSELINRKVIIAEQNYSYMRTLDAEEDKFINELGINKISSFYSNNNYNEKSEEVSNLQKPKLKSIISPDEYLNNRNGILIDEEDNYIKDIYGTLVRINYDYYINEDNEYVIKYENASRKFRWYLSERLDSLYQIKLTDSLKVVPNTSYQLRFCVKKYPRKGLNLRLIYKNNNGDAREVIETTPLRKDYDDEENYNQYNEIVYTNYNEEWGIQCEYICTQFVTLNSSQNVEICLESESDFQISDITLQRVTINHYDSEYMRTSTEYNSCVYDLYADYTEIPSNIKYKDLDIFNKILNRSLPLTKVGFFNFKFNDNTIDKNMNLETQTNIYLDNFLDVESGILSAKDYDNITESNEDGVYEHIYKFNKYIKKDEEYEIIFRPYFVDENNIIFDFNIDITMLVFTEDNHGVKEKLTISEFSEYYNEDENIFKIPFLNKSNNSFEIRIYRNESFAFKDFKLKRNSPLTLEEIT